MACAAVGRGGARGADAAAAAATAAAAFTSQQHAAALTADAAASEGKVGEEKGDDIEIYDMS